MTFDEVVYVDHTDGTPELKIWPSGTKYATYASGDGTETLTFTYAVESDDHDGSDGAIGLSIHTNQLFANNKTRFVDGADVTFGLITDRAGNLADLQHQAAPSTRHEVNGSLESLGPHVTDVAILASGPGADGWYRAGETITVELTFSESVTVSGTPKLALGIDTYTTADAPAANCSGGGTKVTCRYTVRAGDNDSNGISIGATALTVQTVSPVSSIYATGSSPRKNAVLGLTAIANDAVHKVDTTAPVVSDVAIVSSSAPYATGECIDVVVRFDDEVGVSAVGARFGLTVGDGATGTARQAVIKAHDSTDCSNQASQPADYELLFRYVVRDGDKDSTGIGIPADSITGTVRDLAGNTASNPVHDAPADTDGTDDGNHADHTVDASAPGVVSVQITSDPDVDGIDDWYKNGDLITVTVTFDESVDLDTAAETPTIKLQIGSQQRATTEVRSGNANEALEFEYEVADGDYDNDGTIGIVANSLTIPSGSVTDTLGNDAVGTFASSLVTAAEGDHKADGTAPTVSSLSVSSASMPTLGGNFYGAGEHIDINVALSENVVVPSGGDSVSFNLDLDTGNGYADYVEADDYNAADGVRTLTFRYMVQPGDDEPVGIYAAAGTLDGGTVTDPAGNDLNRSHQGLTENTSHKVETVRPAVSEVEVSSTPKMEPTATAT